MTQRFRLTNSRRWGGMGTEGDGKWAERIGRQRLLHVMKYGAKGAVLDKVH
jgi:hypothetical protein